MIPELVDSIGYSPRDGFKRTRVHTASTSAGSAEPPPMPFAGIGRRSWVIERFPTEAGACIGPSAPDTSTSERLPGLNG
jgi:hypothetical protein